MLEVVEPLTLPDDDCKLLADDCALLKLLVDDCILLETLEDVDCWPLEMLLKDDEDAELTRLLCDDATLLELDVGSCWLLMDVEDPELLMLLCDDARLLRLDVDSCWLLIMLDDEGAIEDIEDDDNAALLDPDWDGADELPEVDADDCLTLELAGLDCELLVGSNEVARPVDVLCKDEETLWPVIDAC